MTRPILRGRFDRAVPLSEGTLAAGPSPTTHHAEVDRVRVAITGLPQLKSSLAIDGGESVATTLGRAYRRLGAALLDELHGTFALAIVDDERDEGLLAIDRLGVETLCFAQHGERLVFSVDAGDVAETLRSGHALESSTHGGLDPQSIFDYLYFHCIPGPGTIYRGVSRLLPGHAVMFGRDRVAATAYWQVSYDERRSQPLPKLESEFLSIVRTAVADSIEGAQRPGAFLSGGTDSSTVAGMLTEVTGAPANTYSIGFDADGFDEMSYARIASKRFGTNHHEYYITPADLVESIPHIAAAYDQPFGNSSVLPTYYCARMAAADGIDRMLGGDGGDELFGGNTRYAKQRVFGYFDRAPSLVRGMMRGAFAPAMLESVPVLGKARSYVRQAGVPMPDRMQTYNLLTRIGIEHIFEPDFLARVDPGAPAAAMRTWYARSNAGSQLNRMLAFDLKYTLSDSDLPKVVTACRLGNVDVAFPFLDDAVVEFSTRLRPGLKLKGLQLRWFFKHALRDFLPPEIITKSKHGFGLPFGIWLGRDRNLNELAFSSLESLKQRGIVRIAFIDQLRADLLADHATYYGELVWVLMMLEQWLQGHGRPGGTATTIA